MYSFEKLDVFLGDHNKKFICRQCLSSYTSENMLMKHKQKCGDDNITTIRTSNESHLHWKKHFHKNPLYFRIYADFEAYNEKDNSIIGNKTTNIYKQNPVLNGYHIVSELEDVLKSEYYKSPLGYNNVDWFVDEVLKIENKMAFFFKNTKKDIIMTKEDEEDFRTNNICRFCQKEIISDKVRDHCHLTVITEVQLIVNVILMLPKNKVILYLLYCITLVIMIVICFLKNWLIKKRYSKI